MTWRTWLRQWWCGLWGHDKLLGLDDERAYTYCVSCGWESVGIDVPDTVRAYRRRLVS